MNTNPYLVADLHCDLLTFLARNPNRTFLDHRARSSYPQLLKGGVKVQTLAIYTNTEKGSVKKALTQVHVFNTLLERFPLYFSRKRSTKEKTITLLPAFENASCFLEEDEPLEHGLNRLEELHKKLGIILYISLTWNGENRLGGGCGSKMGLKEDGKQLLLWMNKKKIALDLSHSSDFLSFDSLNFIDKHALHIPVLASHSNFRAICQEERNLPDSLAKEIIRRKGLIGLNFYSKFIDQTRSNPKMLFKHIEHALSLQGDASLAFGADFFYEHDEFPGVEKNPTNGSFFEEYANASKYPQILSTMQQTMQLPISLIKKIASENFIHFLGKSYDF
ncbi:MAG: membrane dipeptidase [Chlamydiales bacterium]|nr:membrane dipeptidase [Chlamydiales bacterium]